jgi:hypothetical protein
VPEHPRDNAPELLTITEAADLLRAPVATLRYWRHLGTGPRSFRLGRRVLYCGSPEIVEGSLCRFSVEGGVLVVDR